MGADDLPFDVYRLLGRPGTAASRLAPRRAEAGGT